MVATPTSPLRLDERCEPVTDGRDQLEVSFTLINVGGEAVDLTYARPVLPLYGLEDLGTTVSLGHCDDPLLSDTPSHLVAPGESVHIRFTLKLPPDCPQPYPVNAEITVSQGSGDDRRFGVGLYPDLGSLAFTTC